MVRNKFFGFGKSIVVSDTLITWPNFGVLSPGVYDDSVVTRDVANEDLPADGLIYCDYTGTDNDSCHLGLDASATNDTLATWEYVVLADAGFSAYGTYVNGAYTDSTIPMVAGDKFGLRRTGTTITAEYYRGGSWTVLRTFPATSSAQLFIHASLDSGKLLTNPKGQGIS